MRVKGINLQQVLLAAMLVAALCWNLANASEIKHLRIETSATGTRAEVQLDREGTYKLIDLRNPDRLVVDFASSGWAAISPFRSQQAWSAPCAAANPNPAPCASCSTWPARSRC